MTSIRLLSICVATMATGFAVETAKGSAPAKPNVLLILVDDLNDWVAPLGGHPLAQTPHLDALARRGTTFLNAHAQAPLCNPSRTSLLMGLRPSTTGIHGLEPSIRTLPEWRDRPSLPQFFQRHGYRTLSVGKVWHSLTPTLRATEFDLVGNAGGVGARPPAKLIGSTPAGNNPLMDWGTFPHRDEDKGDWKVADWAGQQLATLPRDQPFFLSVGFFLPHVPCYVSQPWFDLYPDDDRVLPPVRPAERAGLSRFSWYLHWSLPEPRLSWLRERDQWRNLCRSYLASISFVDSQIGRVLAALDASGQREHTVVVLAGDHGYHLGEKEISGKNTLWERSTRVPFFMAGPGIAADARVTRPAELLDIFPTLADLAGLPALAGLEGLSLVPQLRDATAPRERPAITTHNQGNHGIRSEHHRYIRYADGSEELYDLRDDPHEWTNLAARPTSSALLAEHRRWLPQVDVPAAPASAQRVLTYDPATRRAVWEGRPISEDDPIPFR